MVGRGHAKPDSRTPASSADPRIRSAARRLAEIFRRDRIDVVHAHKGGGRTLTLLARGLRGHGRPSW